MTPPIEGTRPDGEFHNATTVEGQLQTIIDKLKGYQQGPLASEMRSEAIKFIRIGLLLLQHQGP